MCQISFQRAEEKLSRATSGHIQATSFETFARIAEFRSAGTFTSPESPRLPISIYLSVL